MNFRMTSLLVVALFSAVPALALDLPMSFDVCAPATRFLGWNYVQSGNTTEGVQDHQGYIELKFESEMGTYSRVRTAIPNLSWDASFQQIYYTHADGNQTICAQRKWNGFKKVLANCDLDVSSTLVSRGPGEYCADSLFTRIEGRFQIKE